MAIPISSWLARPSTMRSIYRQLKLAIRLLREPRVPAALKVIPAAAVAYVLSPLDLIPDIIPGLGQLDDLAIIALSLELFIRLCPAGARAFHSGAIADGRPFAPMPPRDNVVEAQFRS